MADLTETLANESFYKRLVASEKLMGSLTAKTWLLSKGWTAAAFAQTKYYQVLGPMQKAMGVLGSTAKTVWGNIGAGIIVYKTIAKVITGAGEAVKNFRDRIKETARPYMEMMSYTSMYNREIMHANISQKLFMSSVTMTSGSLEDLRKEAKYTHLGIRYAFNNAIETAQEFGMEVGEVQGLTEKLATTIRGLGKAGKDYDKTLTDTTKDMILFARATGIDANEAMEEFNYQIYTNGKNLEQAKQAVWEMGDTVNRMTDALSKASKPGEPNLFKEDILRAMKEVQRAMPGVKTNVAALGEVMKQVGLKAKAMGLSVTEQTKMMSQIPQLLSSLPDFFKIQIADSFTDAKGSMDSFRKELEKTSPEDAKRLTGIMGLNAPDYMKKKFIFNALKGTPQMMAKTLENIQNMGGATQLSVMEQMFGDDAEKWLGVFQKGGFKTDDIKKAAAEASKRAQDAKASAKASADLQRAAAPWIARIAKALQWLDAKLTKFFSRDSELVSGVFLVGKLLFKLIGLLIIIGAFSKVLGMAKGGFTALGAIAKGLPFIGKYFTGGLMAKLGGLIKGLPGQIWRVGKVVGSSWIRSQAALLGRGAMVAGKFLLGGIGKILMSPFKILSRFATFAGGILTKILIQLGMNGPLATKLGGLAGGMAGVAGAAIMGWKAGQWLDEQLGLSDKISDRLAKGAELDSEIKRARERQGEALQNVGTSLKGLRDLQKRGVKEADVTVTGTGGKKEMRRIKLTEENIKALEAQRKADADAKVTRAKQEEEILMKLKAVHQMQMATPAGAIASMFGKSSAEKQLEGQLNTLRASKEGPTVKTPPPPPAAGSGGSGMGSIKYDPATGNIEMKTTYKKEDVATFTAVGNKLLGVEGRKR